MRACYFYRYFKLLGFGSTNGASTCASTAVNAFVSVDNVFAVYFGNSANGATVCTSAATETCVCIDNVRHSKISFYDLNFFGVYHLHTYEYIVTHFSKKSRSFVLFGRTSLK